MTSIYYNPAGLAFASGTRFYVEGTFAYRTVDYDRDAGAIDNPGTGTPDDAESANAGPAHLGNFLVSPFVGAASDLGIKGLGVGLALYAPFGGQAKWDKNPEYVGNTEFPGAEDSTARWANIEGAQRNVYITLGAAWSSPKHNVGFGAGLNVVSSEVSLTRARNALGTDDLTGEGRSFLEATDLTFSFGIGAMWRTEKAVFGASYQAAPGLGEMSLDGTLRNKFGSASETVVDVTLLQRMPDVARIAAEIDAGPKVVVRLAADLQRWSKFENQCLIDQSDAAPKCAFNSDGSLDTAAGGSGVVVNLPRDYKNTFGVKAGAGYTLNDKIELGGSLSYDSNAIPDATMDPSLFDMNKVILQLGIDAVLHEKLSLHGTLGQVFYQSRTTAPRTEDPEAPSLNPDMAGKYSSSVTYAMVGVGVEL